MNAENDYKRWSLEENEVLKNIYNNTSYPELSSIFGRTVGAIKAQASKLCLLHSIRKSIIGEKYGKLLVLEKTNEWNKQGNPVYKCLCDCGKFHYLSSNSLNHKHGTKSCGCMAYTGTQRRKAYGESSMLNLMSLYKHKAIKRNIIFELNINEFKSMTSMECYYCGCPPNQIHKGAGGSGRSYGNYIYNGIDRVDNSKGYTIDNCVSCCGKCNHAKDIMSKNEFISWIEAVHNHIGKYHEDYCMLSNT